MVADLAVVADGTRDKAEAPIQDRRDRSTARVRRQHLTFFGYAKSWCGLTGDVDGRRSPFPQTSTCH